MNSQPTTSQGNGPRVKGTQSQNLLANKVRADFPILQTKMHGRPLVYLDNAATTHKPQVVIETLRRFYASENANVHRGVYKLSAEASERYEAVRTKVCQFLGTKNTREIVFTKGTTEGINLVVSTLGRQRIKKGDTIAVTRMEHHSNFVPWQALAEEKGARLRIVELTSDLRLDLSDLKKALSEKPKIFAFTWMSNALGVINPVAEIAEMAKAAGCVVLVDAAQGMFHFPANISEKGPIDFLTFSGHKMGGPTGIGVLWGREELLAEMPPYQYGGDMILQVRDDKTHFNDLPWKFEAGTPPVAEVLGLGEAIDYLQKIGLDRIAKEEPKYVEYALERLLSIPHLKLVGPKSSADRGAVFSFEVDKIHPHDLATYLDREGIAVRAGHHCTQPLMHKLGLTATCRASLCFYNTLEEVDFLGEALLRAIAYFK